LSIIQGKNLVTDFQIKISGEEKQRKKNMTKQIVGIQPMNPTFQVTEEKVTDTRSIVTIEPLEQGYGHTLGNAMRRVLLTSLPGYAITQVRIDGVDHQYSTLEGMTEDIVQLILNLKQVRIMSTNSEAGTLKLSVKGEKDVTAADIECSAGYEVVNKSLSIAKLAKGKSLNVEMVVEPGIGYVLADDQKAKAIGDIVVDALFSPILKVSYTVESTRVGRRTDFDKLVMDIDTNGSLTALEAVNKAARILARQFTQVFEPVLPEVETPVLELSPEETEVLRLTVEELDLPTRIANALRKGGFKTVGDLRGANRNVVAKVKNLGEKSVVIIDEALSKKGVSLGE
jgi:DNA-directed RNA polymerase subunit alpha